MNDPSNAFTKRHSFQICRIRRGICLLPGSSASTESLVGPQAAESALRGSGVYYRQVSSESASKMVERTVRPLLEAVRQSGNDLTLLCCTTTPEQISPATASLAFAQLGINDLSVHCMDIASSCTSFLSALRVGSHLVSKQHSVIVAAAEQKSVHLPKDDHKLLSIFGDGAAAVLLEYDETMSNGFSFCYASQFPEFSDHIASKFDLGKGVLHIREPKRMFRVIVDAFVQAILSCWKSRLEILGASAAKVGGIVYLHQANKNILVEVKKKLPPEIAERIVILMHDIGNTVSASLPMLLARFEAIGKTNGSERNFLVIDDEGARRSDLMSAEELSEAKHIYDRFEKPYVESLDLMIAVGGGLQAIGCLFKHPNVQNSP